MSGKQIKNNGSSVYKGLMNVALFFYFQSFEKVAWKRLCKRTGHCSEPTSYGGQLWLMAFIFWQHQKNQINYNFFLKNKLLKIVFWGKAFLNKGFRSNLQVIWKSFTGQVY